MKMREKQLDNRGAAMVTILIAVTFMTIMASSLMYMAYMNYMTKSMRYSSTDNFYTDEFALDDLATSLQRIAASENKIADAKNAILTAVGDNNGTPRTYDNEKVAALITIANQEVETISVNCVLADTSDPNSLVVSNDYIKLRGVSITATTPEGYQSTITSDITISFPNTIPGEIDINDFSVITDSPLIFNMGGSRYFSGNVFAQKTGSGGGNGMEVSNKSVIGLLSPQVMIVGDVLVTGDSTLHVTGTMTVYGKIRVDEGSALICSGTIRTRDGIFGDGTFKGVSKDPNGNPDLQRSDYLGDDGLLTKLFFNVWVRNGNGDDRTFDLSLHNNGGFGNVALSTDNQADPRCHILTRSDAYNVTNAADCIYQNSLILVDKPVSGNPLQIKFYVHEGVIAETTVLSSGPIDYGYEQGTSYMSKMSDEAYEFAKNYLFVPAGGQIYTRDSLGGNIDCVNVASGGNNIAFANGRVDDIPAGVTIFQKNNGDRNEDYMYGDNKNYLPIYKFLNPDSSAIISDIFSKPTGSADPKNSIIIYEIWSKD